MSAGRAAGIEQWQIDADYPKFVGAVPGPPRGVGVSVSQVEAPLGTTEEINLGQGRYFPDPAIAEFLADASGPAVAFIDGSGFQANGISSHASGIGQFFYGNTFGVARGVTSVTMYDANRWLNDQLHVDDPGLAPEPQTFQVQNHSWIHSFAPSDPQSDQLALKNFDYVIDSGDMTAVVGTNNNPLGVGLPNPALAHPNLLAHSYNAIAVGRSDSRHSRGTTNSIYGPSRYRPDIVSNALSTSQATGQVSSVAAVLRGAVTGTDADRSETMKAIVLAGATKQEFAGFVDPATGMANPWNRTTTRPLDDLFGAGELNIYNSYLMTAGGQHAGSFTQPTSAVSTAGWDYRNRKGDASVQDVYYKFVVPTGSTATDLSIILSWNVKVSDEDPLPSVFTPIESLQNLDLAFYNSTNSFLGVQLDQSISVVDNVEHIFQPNLGPGTYTLKVTGSQNWDYGLAWRMTTAFDVANADFDQNGGVDGSDFLVWQRNLGKLVGALQTEGDADGDGDVDQGDLSLFKFALANPPLLAAAGSGSTISSAVNSISAIPEPATIVSAAAALGFWSLAGLGRRRRA